MAYTTIDDPSAYFQTTLYTGNRSSSQTITNDGNSDLKPDWLWIKPRNDTVLHSHSLFDSTRGVTKGLASNLNEAEYTTSSKVTSFNTDGFSIGNGASVNQPDRDVNYVTWQWKANGGTTSSNTDGSITSTVQANTTAGFSIVTYTGNGSDNSTIGHGLGKAPAMIIIKGRSSVEDWMIYHKVLTAGSEIILNSTSAQADDTNNATWGDNHPSSVGSSTFAVGYAGDSNANGTTYVAYCFAEIKGYSKFGKYTGNGTGTFGPFADGPFVYTGFKPAWVMIKRTNGANGWTIFDNKRDPHNIVGNQLSANSTAAEEGDASHHSERDYLSNGFKLKGNGNDINANGGTYIYMAFAEHPFVSSKGVPVTAR